MATTVGICMTTNVGIHMTTNAGIYTTMIVPVVCLRMSQLYDYEC